MTTPQRASHLNFVLLGDVAVNTTEVMYCDRSTRNKNTTHLILSGGRSVLVGLTLEEVVQRLNGESSDPVQR